MGIGVASTTAKGADMEQPAFKGAPKPAAYDWSGFYIGGHAGWAQVDRGFDQTMVGAGAVIVNPGFDQKSDGILGGAQAGFNQQHGNWLWGFEAEVSLGNIDAATTVVSAP